MNRYLTPYIKEDLEEKMVFIGGPRQVGKTTLTEQLLSDFVNGEYYNWDALPDRIKIEKQQFSPDAKLLIFDELHKFPQWKQYIKGLYDTQKIKHSFLVTGSARLDLYQKGGDSLLGRYHYYRLHPFSVAELLKKEFDIPQFLEKKEIDFSLPQSTQEKANKYVDELFDKGGFPEPLLTKKIRTQLRWSQERTRKLIHEDIRDISFIKMISDLEKLVYILPSKIGSLFSIKSLGEDLSVSQPTIKEWMQLLENFYYIFRISPYNTSAIKSLKKEQKVFLWDYSEIQNDGAKFENCIGSHLLKWVHFMQDTYGVKIELHYLRDKEKREVDFFITLDGKPFMAVEVKLSDIKPSKHLQYFNKKIDIPFCFQIVKTENIDFIEKDIRVMSAGKFLAGLV